jgi:hypothetical protein
MRKIVESVPQPDPDGVPGRVDAVHGAGHEAALGGDGAEQEVGPDVAKVRRHERVDVGGAV